MAGWDNIRVSFESIPKDLKGKRQNPIRMNGMKRLTFLRIILVSLKFIE
jgi:hypothetical protein